MKGHMASVRTTTMLRSSYAQLEEQARKGLVLVVVAICMHLTACILSLAALGVNPLKMVWPMLIQAAFCAALYVGKRWGKWVLVIWNGAAGAFLVYMWVSGMSESVIFSSVRASVCGVVILLLLLPPVQSFLTWKNMRF